MRCPMGLIVKLVKCTSYSIRLSHDPGDSAALRQFMRLLTGLVTR